MMPARIHYEVDTRRLEQIMRNLPGKTEDNNRAIAFRVEAGAKSKSPVDTGANRASIYTRCGNQDGFNEAAAKVKSSRPDGVMLQLPKPEGHDAHVGPSMDYSEELEFGAHGRAARPYLVPAVREVENALAAQWGNIADG